MAKTLRRKKPVATISRDESLRCLLVNHEPNEVGALVLASVALPMFPVMVRDTLESLEWIQNTRARLTAIEDPPASLTAVLDSGGVSAEGRAAVEAFPGGSAMANQFQAAVNLAAAVRQARLLLPATSEFGRRKSWGRRLRGFVEMPATDVVAVLLNCAERASFTARFSATEAMSFAVLTNYEAPTAMAEQRLNTWSKRLIRTRRHAEPTLVNLLRVYLQIYAARIPDRAALEDLLRSVSGGKALMR